MAVRHWIGSGVASLLAHGAFFGGLGWSLAPNPVEQHPVPKSELTVTSYQVEQSEAAAKALPGETAQEEAPNAPRMGEGTIARSNAKPVELDPAELESWSSKGEELGSVKVDVATAPIIATKGVTVNVAEASVDAVAPLAPLGTRVKSAQPDSAKLGTIAANAPTSTAVVAEADSVISKALTAELSGSLSAQGALLESAEPLSFPLGNSDTSPEKIEDVSAQQSLQIASLETPPAGDAVQANLQSTVSDAIKLQAVRAQSALPQSARAVEPVATGMSIAPSFAPSPSAREQDLPSEYATAALAWSGSDERVVDPVSLAAIQAFMKPSDLNDAGAGNEVRDGIEALLASVPCARLQTEFDPTTGSLLVRGHIPEDGLRGPVLDALKAQIGNSIPVKDTLLILPRPQCGALSGIADIGLPQSTDQITNPRVVGPQGFARNYNYSNGQRLVLELGAPDYPSVIYVDYFSADGMVLHLQPNTIVPLETYAAKSAFTVGKERRDGPSVNLTISPPFGQEIAVAFAASRPIYEGLRPVSEPAEPYLDFLRSQIAQARSLDPNFKGEWVYFFVSTTPE